MKPNKPSAAAMRAVRAADDAFAGDWRERPHEDIAQYIDAEIQPLIEALASLTEPGISADELYRRREPARTVLKRARGEET